MFVAQLIQEGSLEPTIKSYTSAVKAILRENGIEVEYNSVALCLLLRSCKYTTGIGSTTRIPIQKGLLKLIIDKLDKYFLQEFNQPYLCILYKAIVVAGYYGMMRIGELIDSECDHAIKFSDVHYARNKSKVM